MKLRIIALVAGALFCTLSPQVIAQTAHEWVAINNPAELRAMYSNKTFKVTMENGTSYVAYYNADGRGLVIYKNRKIPRIWKVKGNNQVCIVAVMAPTNCYLFWRERDKRSEIKGMNIAKGWTFRATVEDGIPNF